MHDDNVFKMLGALLGRQATIEGRKLCLIEILRDGPILILQEEGNLLLQDNLYGQPRRHAPRHFLIPLISELGDRLHPIARQFMSTEEADALTRMLFAGTD